jgi:hypothetical protein
MNPKHWRPVVLALALVIAALLAPAAQARTEGAPLSPVAPSEQVRVVTVSSDSGFDWGDALLGAAAVVAVGMVGAGAALAIGSHRHRRLEPTAQH